MGVFNLDSEEFKPPKEVTQSLAQVTCPGYTVEQSQELLKASGLSPVHPKKLCCHFLYTRECVEKRRTFYSILKTLQFPMSIVNSVLKHDCMR